MKMRVDTTSRSESKFKVYHLWDEELKNCEGIRWLIRGLRID